MSDCDNSLSNICQCGHMRADHNEFVNPGCYAPGCRCKGFSLTGEGTQAILYRHRKTQMPNTIGNIVSAILEISEIEWVEVKKRYEKTDFTNSYLIRGYHDNGTYFIAYDLPLKTLELAQFDLAQYISSEFQVNLRLHKGKK